MRLNRLALGLALGIVWGAVMVGSTLYFLFKGEVPDAAQYAKFIYPGYNISATGAIIGGVWGGIDGFISGFIIASLYNLFAGREKLKKDEKEQ